MDTVGIERAQNLRYRGYLEKTTSSLMLKVEQMENEELERAGHQEPQRQ